MSSPRRVAACLFVPLILLVAGLVAPGQESPPQKDPVLLDLDARVGQFLTSLSLGETRKAYQELLADTRLAQQETALKQLIEKTQQIDARYGRYCGSEQISAEHVGNDLVLLRYLYRCKDFPVVWYFAFYRTPTLDEMPPEKAPWRVVAVRFDTELERLAR